MKKAIYSLCIVPLMLVACGGSEDQAAVGGAMPPMAVQVHVLKAESLDNSITTTGTLLANEEVDLVSELAGRVTMIGFQEGGHVGAGQALVRINDDELQAQLRKAEANLKLGTDDEARKKQLLAVNGISQEQYDAAQAQLAALQADADHLRAQIAKSTIRAPFSGKVGLRSISEGGFVASNTRIAKLQQTDPMKVEFAVPERYGRIMKTGALINFTLEGDTSTYTGEVYAVDPSVDATTRTVKVRARSRNQDGRLFPGAFAKVEARLERLNDALIIPAEALIPDIQGQKVLLMKGGKAVSARVQLGNRTANSVQLTSGVQAGDSVIITGLLALREGMAVRALPATAPAKSEVSESTAR
ncbi:MAG TPA: efflux RND transporter periplasmic adaptor subunit [Flavobacteriales bacterium]|nr:efflux RND transporter periplasmic adaptor subunit [Flavobacteriales bacterium]